MGLLIPLLGTPLCSICNVKRRNKSGGLGGVCFGVKKSLKMWREEKKAKKKKGGKVSIGLMHSGTVACN